MSNPVDSAPMVAGIVKIEIRDVAGQDYLGKRFTSALESVGGDVQAAMRELYQRIESAGSAPSGPPFLITSQPDRGSMSLEAGAPCAPVPEPAGGQHRGRLEPGKAAVALYRGPYDKIGPVYGAIFEWSARQGRRPAGAPREVYLNGPDEVASAADYLTEVVLPVV